MTIDEQRWESQIKINDVQIELYRIQEEINLKSFYTDTAFLILLLLLSILVAVVVYRLKKRGVL